MLKSIFLTASVVALTVTPIAASAATAASKLSVSSASRAATPTGKSNRLTGAGIGPIAGGIIAAGIAIAAVILISDKEDDDNPDSN